MFERFYGIILQIGVSRVHNVRVMGGSLKFRALRLDHGNFSWGSESESFFSPFQQRYQVLERFYESLRSLMMI